MLAKLSASAIIIFVVAGILTFVMLFIFAKRQIMRFAIRSRRGPHAPIGHEAKKSMRREIERRIELIPRIIYEAKLLRGAQDVGQAQIVPGTQLISTYYRLRAVDDIKILEKELGIIRHPSESVRTVLVSTLCAASEPLSGPAQKVVHQFCDLYEHARHGAADFGENEYNTYTCLFKKLVEAGKQPRSLSVIHKSSPNRTPKRRHTRIPSSLPLAEVCSDQSNETRV
ncbi:protein C1orf43 homolog [Neocloeon triangulifer]|uniref:protein C1orf43 homolog n=1 Tax=Neocloeon triangulifer TaxID=2078957 RepID=UPI00286F0BC1|nr:protein C1orf43 homolog [Neocloeon triangulifer]